MIGVVEQCVRADSHGAKRDEFVLLDADMVEPLTIVEEVKDVSRASPAWTVVGFRGEVLAEVGGIVREEAMSHCEPQNCGGAVS